MLTLRRLSLVLLAAVACATPYQPSAFRGGYDDLQLAENVFRVSFEGNAALSSQRAADYALLRSAEVTVEKGFRYFVIANDANTARVTGGGGQNASFVASLPTSVQTIVCYTEKPSDATGLVYDALGVRAALRARYEISESSRRAEPAPLPPGALQRCEQSYDCYRGHSCIEGYCR